MLRIDMTGAEGLEAALRAVEKDATKRTVGRTALRAGAGVIADRARELVPVRRGVLRDSITIAGKLSRRQKRMHRKSKDGIDVFVGCGGDGARHASLIEFGTWRTRSYPFMRPAWDGKKKEALEAIIMTMKIRVEKTLARQAKKAATKRRGR